MSEYKKILELLEHDDETNKVLGLHILLGLNDIELGQFLFVLANKLRHQNGYLKGLFVCANREIYGKNGFTFWRSLEIHFEYHSGTDWMDIFLDMHYDREIDYDYMQHRISDVVRTGPVCVMHEGKYINIYSLDEDKRNTLEKIFKAFINACGEDNLGFFSKPPTTLKI